MGKKQDWSHYDRSRSSSPKPSGRHLEVENSVKYWYYVIYARVGEPGFADDDWYSSSHFNSFEKCFRSYINFNPHTKFNHFRYIGNERFIYVNNNVENVNDANGGILYYYNAENDLGITENEFDKIIATYSNQN